MRCQCGLTIDAKIPVVVEELPHAVAFVVDDAVAITDADAFIRNAERVNGIRKDLRQWIVKAIGILVGTFEEVDPHGRWVFAVANGIAGGFIELVPIVTVSKAATHIHPHVVVRVPPQIDIHPLRHVGVGQRLRSLVDEDVVVKRHVVDLVVGRKRKGLRTDLHPDRLSLGFRVNVALVVEDPVEVLVSIQRDQILPATVPTVNLLQEVKPWVISRCRIVRPIAVEIEEGSQIIILIQAWIAMGWIFVEIRWVRIPIREVGVDRASDDGLVILTMPLGIRTETHREPIVRVARVWVGFGRAVVGQWSRPKIVARGPVADRRQFELLVRADAAQPKGSAVHHRHAFLFGHEMRSAVDGAVVPQRPSIFNQSTDVVPLQIAQCGRWGTGLRARPQRRHVGWRRHRQSFLIANLSLSESDRCQEKKGECRGQSLRGTLSGKGKIVLHESKSGGRKER